MAGYVHINRPSSTRFCARVRARGHRKYKLLGKPTLKFETALRRVANAIAKNSWWKRGDVLLTADYYDPQVIAEIVRR